MQSCEFAMTIIALYAAFFSQLGDTLATIAAHQEFCAPKDSASPTADVSESI